MNNTTAYEIGRTAFASNNTESSNPFPALTADAEAWMNGLLDAEQSAITGWACEARR